MSPEETRIEHDALGIVRVPAARLWGAQTQRALTNFPPAGDRYRWRPSVIRALGIIKKGAAQTNRALRILPRNKSGWIVRAADEVIAGRWDDEFPLGLFQSGSGTQSNMNANEVIANRAIQLAGGVVGSKKPVHPNDDVNLGQSSNDVFSSVMHLATLETVETTLQPALDLLERTLASKQAGFSSIVMIGRTHLQDAVPIGLGQVVSGWGAQIHAARECVVLALAGLRELPLGGTAVGTGLNAPDGFAEGIVGRISEETGRPFRICTNRFASLAAHDALVNFSGSIRTLAGALLKVANDIRWYASGPRAGLGELQLPENEPGSSIMPGKINPTQCEQLAMAAMAVFGNDQSLAIAGSQGNFQLNTCKPLILHCVLESLHLLSAACTSFVERCLAGLAARTDRIQENLDRSLMLATALVPEIGYDSASQIARVAQRDNLSLREAALKLGYVTGEDFDRLIRPASMIGK